MFTLILTILSFVFGVPSAMVILSLVFFLGGTSAFMTPPEMEAARANFVQSQPGA